jgi:hypothetical protein
MGQFPSQPEGGLSLFQGLVWKSEKVEDPARIAKGEHAGILSVTNNMSVMLLWGVQGDRLFQMLSCPACVGHPAQRISKTEVGFDQEVGVLLIVSKG